MPYSKRFVSATQFYHPPPKHRLYPIYFASQGHSGFAALPIVGRYSHSGLAGFLPPVSPGAFVHHLPLCIPPVMGKCSRGENIALQQAFVRGVTNSSTPGRFVAWRGKFLRLRGIVALTPLRSVGRVSIARLVLLRAISRNLTWRFAFFRVLCVLFRVLRRAFREG